MNTEQTDSMNKEKLDRLKFESDRLWQYFQYHAQQRIETLRFFIILSGVIITGAATVISRFEIKFLNIYLFASLSLGLMLVLFSIAFWMLDHRNNTMVRKSRDEIINLEESNLINHKIFTTVKKFSDDASSVKFHHCFWIIFISFIVVGFMITIYSFCKLYCH